MGAYRNMRRSISELISGIEIPRMLQVKQNFDCSLISREEIPHIIESVFCEEEIKNRIKKNTRIAITAGSRGIKNSALIIRSIADAVKKRGADPFIVPAMGSHGGSTAEGQKEILKSYGITEEYCGCRIIASMEVVKIGVTEDGQEVYIDKYANEADGIILFNRIKPHTSFRGPYESGIMKMMAIGLGKRKGAEACHSKGFQHMARNVQMFGKTILQNANILFAVASLENAYDETCRLVGIDAAKIEEKEPILLKEAYSYMPRIFLESCDVLIVDEIGKNYSGCGMDPNITGRFDTPYANGGINAQRVAVLRLSRETHGNGIGIGVSDVIPRAVFENLDLDVMYLNAMTTTVFTSSKIPMIVENEKEAIQLCIKTCVGIDTNHIRVVRIKNTLQLDQIMVSEAYYNAIQSDPRFTIISEPFDMSFDGNGNLTC